MKPQVIEMATAQECEWACQFVSKYIAELGVMTQNPNYKNLSPSAKQKCQGNREPWILDWGLAKHKIMEETCGFELYPSTVFWRVMGPGYILYDHKDYHHCQISASITCGFGGDLEKPTPLNVEGIDYDIPVGYGLVYDGVKQMHGRKEQPGGWQLMMLCHYVRKDSEEYKTLSEKMDVSTPFKLIPELHPAANPILNESLPDFDEIKIS